MSFNVLLFFRKGCIRQHVKEEAHASSDQVSTIQNMIYLWKGRDNWLRKCDKKIKKDDKLI